MGRPNIQAIRSKLTTINDTATRQLVAELLEYVQNLEKKPNSPVKKPKSKGKTAKEYRELIDMNELPFNAKEKPEDRLPYMVDKLLSYAESLETS